MMSALTPLKRLRSSIESLLDSPEKTKKPRANSKGINLQKSQTSDTVSSGSGQLASKIEVITALNSGTAPKVRARPEVAAEVGGIPSSPAEPLSEPAILLKLFDGMEHVLRLTASRKRHTPLDELRQDLVGYVGRDLTTDRLEKILALAGGMFEVLWIGSGFSAFMSIEQRDGDSRSKAPTAEELVERKSRYGSALDVAVKSGELPRRSLPPRPAGIQRAPTRDVLPVIVSNAAAAALAEAAALPPLAKRGSSSESRLQALRARVLARKPILDRQAAYEAEQKRLERVANACEDSIVAHAVLAHLFARAEGQAACATEAELLFEVTSPRCKRPLSPEAGKDAVAKLLQVGAGTWFSIEKAVYSTKAGSFLRPLPEGPRCASVIVLETLENDLRQVYDKKQRLAADGPSAFELGENKIAINAAAPQTTVRQPEIKVSIEEVEAPISKTEAKSNGQASVTAKTLTEPKADAQGSESEVKINSKASATPKAHQETEQNSPKSKPEVKDGRRTTAAAKAQPKAKSRAKASAHAAAEAAAEAPARRRSTRKSGGAR
eukprot:TRINITY_DN732_c0_g2_i1.p1 TRINITY_DN732_c0_g2~~TRINITY_DN732_c0_g2_i1.p1  ORF type:complete len:551 (-),score=111.07 TRINITY_DN732_c0_g2_i1:62-1714(-)